jgi:trehalose 2-sulfotransferase
MSPLEGIETGYEERYDFPYRHRLPEHAYVLASVPRTGSSFVSHLLWRTGCLGAPLEYLNFVPTGPARFAVEDPVAQSILWQSMLHRRTSPNGVFGVKCFSVQLRELQQRNPSLLREVFAMLLFRGPASRVVRLKRRDRVAHAVSYARALLSGVWRKEQEGNETAGVEYSAEAVDHAREYLDRQEADWDMLFGELGIEPLTLWYEDILERPEEAVQTVADYLGVALDPAAEVPIYQVEKQSEEDSRRWRERYAGQAKE